MTIRVFLADDHALVRQGLRALLEREGFQVVGEASNGQEAVRLVPDVRPDVAILDISMPILNGLDAARELQRSSQKMRTVLLTRHDEDQYVTEALRAGVRGYVLKSQAATDLVHAIQQVCVAGEILSSAQVFRARLWRRFCPGRHFRPIRSHLPRAPGFFNSSARVSRARRLRRSWESA